MLGVAILGTWHVHAEDYAQEFANNPNTQIIAVWCTDMAAGKHLAHKWSAEFDANLDDLLRRQDIDLVCITAETALHKDLMIKAARQGKHIFTEKVLTASVKEAYEVQNAILSSDVKFTISLPKRTLGCNILAKETVSNELLGKINYLRVRRTHNGAYDGWLPERFYNQEQSCGGAMIDLGAHPIYLILWLFGLPMTVSSTFSNIIRDDVEDQGICVFRYDDGKIAIAETSFACHCNNTILELHGTEGSLIVYADESVKINSRKLNATDFIDIEHLPNNGPSAIDQLVRAIKENNAIEFDINEAIKLTEVMDAAYQSYELKKEVPIHHVERI